MMKSSNSLPEDVKVKGAGPYTTVNLSDESYAGLLLKVEEYFLGLVVDYDVVFSHIVSDRYSKRAYFVAVLKSKPRTA